MAVVNELHRTERVVELNFTASRDCHAFCSNTPPEAQSYLLWFTAKSNEKRCDQTCLSLVFSHVEKSTALTLTCAVVLPRGVGLPKTNISLQFTFGFMCHIFGIADLLGIQLCTALLAFATRSHVNRIHLTVFIISTVNLVARVNIWKYKP